MPTKIEVKNDVTNAKEDVQGSDGRMNVSSRSDDRIFYASRDNEAAFTVVSDDTDIAAGDFGLYLQNNDVTGREIHIRSITVGNEEVADWKFHYVTGTASGGSALTPFCQNRGGQDEAPVTALGNTAVTIGTSTGVFNTIRNPANTTKIVDLHDAVILKQGDAIAIEYDRGTTGEGDITVSFYFEQR